MESDVEENMESDVVILTRNRINLRDDITIAALMKEKKGMKKQIYRIKQQKRNNLIII